jgi:hypothetical protein
LRLRAMIGISRCILAERMADAAVFVRRDWSSLLPLSLTCLSSPGRAGDIQSSPRAGGAGRAHSARLDGVEQVRLARHRQARKFLHRRASCAPQCVRVRSSRMRWREPLAGGSSLSRERAQNRLPSLGGLISLVFRKKRRQADSCDGSLTSTPTTTISAAGGVAFISPS